MKFQLYWIILLLPRSHRCWRKIKELSIIAPLSNHQDYHSWLEYNWQLIQVLTNNCGFKSSFSYFAVRRELQHLESKQEKIRNLKRKQTKQDIVDSSSSSPASSSYFKPYHCPGLRLERKICRKFWATQVQFVVFCDLGKGK